MAYWLIKSEPSAYSWAQMVIDKKTGWSGVRNHQASNNMKAMKKGDLAFFYHSNEGREIVGIVSIGKTYHLDPTDKTGKFGMVEVQDPKPMARAVTLAEIKLNAKLKGMALIRQSRLSVSPVSEDEWKEICRLASLKA